MQKVQVFFTSEYNTVEKHYKCILKQGRYKQQANAVGRLPTRLNITSLYSFRYEEKKCYQTIFFEPNSFTFQNCT